MATTSTTQLRRAAAAIGLAAASIGGALAAAPAAEAAPKIAGMTLTSTPAGSDRSESLLRVQLTTGRSIRATCVGANSGVLTLNGTSTGYACRTLGQLDLIGSSGNDTVDAQLGGENFIRLVVDLGVGNDVATAVTSRAASLLGGAGNDRLTHTWYLRVGGYFDPGYGVSSGGPGDDVLDNRGFTGPGTRPSPSLPGSPWADVGQGLIGGPGVDTIYGNDVRADWVTAETIDRLVLSGGPGGLSMLGTPGADTFGVESNGNYGTKLSVTSAGKATSWTLPSQLVLLTVDGLGGNDAVTIEHRSKTTAVVAWDSSGTDKLTLLPSLAGWSSRTYANGNGGVVTQPGWQPMSYGAEGSQDGGPRGGFETVTVTPRLRP